MKDQYVVGILAREGWQVLWGYNYKFFFVFMHGQYVSIIMNMEKLYYLRNVVEL